MTAIKCQAEMSAYATEVIETFRRHHHVRCLVAVFGSASQTLESLENPADLIQAIATHLSAPGYGIVNGGYMGSMSGMAALVTGLGGHALGITARNLDDGSAPQAFTAIHAANDHWERLAILVNSADAYVILPGGIGTLVEFSAVIWAIDRRFIASRPLVFIGEFWRRQLDVLRENPISLTSSATLSNALVVDTVDEFRDALTRCLPQVHDDINAT